MSITFRKGFRVFPGVRLNINRRREDTPMPETTTEVPAVLMQFRTRGRAVVQVESKNPTALDTVYPYRCLGCDDEGESRYVDNARRAANEHAGACWSMPKPDSPAGEA